MDGVVGLISHSNWMEKKEKKRKGNRGERGGCARPAVWGGGRLILTGHDFTVFFLLLPPSLPENGWYTMGSSSIQGRRCVCVAPVVL